MTTTSQLTTSNYSTVYSDLASQSKKTGYINASQYSSTSIKGADGKSTTIGALLGSGQISLSTAKDETNTYLKEHAQTATATSSASSSSSKKSTTIAMA